MDLGGASTQIAFVVVDDHKGPDYMHIKLYGYSYSVYTHSFLCYGKNEADKRILDKIIQVWSFFFLYLTCVHVCTEGTVYNWSSYLPVIIRDVVLLRACTVNVSILVFKCLCEVHVTVGMCVFSAYMYKLKAINAHLRID